MYPVTAFIKFTLFCFYTWTWINPSAAFKQSPFYQHCHLNIGYQPMYIHQSQRQTLVHREILAAKNFKKLIFFFSEKKIFWVNLSSFQFPCLLLLISNVVFLVSPKYVRMGGVWAFFFFIFQVINIAPGPNLPFTPSFKCKCFISIHMKFPSKIHILRTVFPYGKSFTLNFIVFKTKSLKTAFLHYSFVSRV